MNRDRKGATVRTVSELFELRRSRYFMAHQLANTRSKSQESLMSLSRTAAVFFVLAPFAFGASKEILELQRDIAMLQDQVRNMQRSIDEKFGATQTMLQQTLDSANRTNTAVAVMQSRFNDAVKEQQQGVGSQINTVGSKLDQMAEDFRAVRESVLDMNTRMGKLDARMAALQNLISTIRAPAPPPPAAPGAAPTDGQAPS